MDEHGWNIEGPYEWVWVDEIRPAIESVVDAIVESRHDRGVEAFAVDVRHEVEAACGPMVIWIAGSGLRRPRRA